MEHIYETLQHPLSTHSVLCKIHTYSLVFGSSITRYLYTKT